MEKILIFGKYDPDEVSIKDPSLVKYMNLKSRFVFHTHGFYGRKHFGKKEMNIVERLINNLMRTEKYTGKKLSAYRVVMKAFEIINERTKKNPLQVLVNALENAAPREEVTRLKMGGVAVPKAVDVSASRRLDVAIRNIALGAMQCSFKNTKPIYECLADEIVKASNYDMSSFAISKKEEVERIAASAR
ncbi:MAG: 30S ribosomal protein S7 [Thermoplasmata archaeon]|nr:30S ribosomal protein S7 [Thermoplasmata archaeon]